MACCKSNHKDYEQNDQRILNHMCGKCSTTMLKTCYRSYLWVEYAICSPKVVECNSSDLSPLLVCFKNKNNIFDPLGYYLGVKAHFEGAQDYCNIILFLRILMFELQPCNY